MTEPSLLLRVDSVVKTFPGLTALDRVSLDVRSGEVVAVIGHNGSGKSTLVKVLAGVHTQDSGAATPVDGAEIHFIHQDLALVGELTTIENLNLVKASGASALHPSRPTAERARARDLVARFGEVFDVDVPVRALTPAQRAIVAIARALDGWTHGRNVIVLDEPTESLHRSEVDVLFDAVRRLAAEGAGVVFISHRLDEVLSLADRVAVLRDGRKVADEPVSSMDHDRLVELITGASVTSSVARAGTRRPDADPVLAVRGLVGEAVAHLDLELYPGEVVGVAGVLGSGREAVSSLLFGAVEARADTFAVHGEPYPRRSPARSIRRRMAFVPAERARYGAIRPMTARENVTLPQLRTLRNRFGAVVRRLEQAEAARLMTAYRVVPPRPEQTFALFSGGNQQKLVLARWLRDDPAVLLLDEPTQGVDIGAKATIYDAVAQAAAAGTAVLVSSSDAKELLRLCDRVLVLRDGRVAAELHGEDLTEHRLVVEGYGLERPAPPSGGPSPNPRPAQGEP